jgi:DUF917 family protein
MKRNIIFYNWDFTFNNENFWTNKSENIVYIVDKIITILEDRKGNEVVESEVRI